MSVYLVQFSEDPSLIKIGYSKTPRERIKTLESYYGPALHIYTIKDEDSVKELSPINTPLNVELSIVLNDLTVTTNYILSMKNKINL